MEFGFYNIDTSRSGIRALTLTYHEVMLGLLRWHFTKWNSSFNIDTSVTLRSGISALTLTYLIHVRTVTCSRVSRLRPVFWLRQSTRGWQRKTITWRSARETWSLSGNSRRCGGRENSTARFVLSVILGASFLLVSVTDSKGGRRWGRPLFPYWLKFFPKSRLFRVKGL